MVRMMGHTKKNFTEEDADAAPWLQIRFVLHVTGLGVNDMNHVFRTIDLI
jgi:hypothetical protein